MISGDSLSRKDSKPFLIAARRPLTFHEMSFCGDINSGLVRETAQVSV